VPLNAAIRLTIPGCANEISSFCLALRNLFQFAALTIFCQHTILIIGCLLALINAQMTEPIENALAFPALQPSRKSGDERFSLSGETLDLRLSAFWQWSSSDLVSNAMRGVLAEFLVASALGLADGVRNQWDAFDLRLADGTRLEVKSAAHLQSWAHAKLSNIAFTIRPTLAWSAETNRLSSELRRQADIYVFCLLDHRDKATLDPMRLEQWKFYLLRSAVLNERHPSQKTITLSGLLKLSPLEATFENLAVRVAELARER
jgi:hypothetical protein